MDKDNLRKIKIILILFMVVFIIIKGRNIYKSKISKNTNEINQLLEDNPDYTKDIIDELLEVSWYNELDEVYWSFEPNNGFVIIDDIKKRNYIILDDYRIKIIDVETYYIDFKYKNGILSFKDDFLINKKPEKEEPKMAKSFKVIMPTKKEFGFIQIINSDSLREYHVFDDALDVKQINNSNNYEFISPTIGALVKIKNGNKFGLVNYEGEVIIEPIFAHVQHNAGDNFILTATYDEKNEYGEKIIKHYLYNLQGELLDKEISEKKGHKPIYYPMKNNILFKNLIYDTNGKIIKEIPKDIVSDIEVLNDKEKGVYISNLLESNGYLVMVNKYITKIFTLDFELINTIEHELRYYKLDEINFKVEDDNLIEIEPVNLVKYEINSNEYYEIIEIEGNQYKALYPNYNNEEIKKEMFPGGYIPLQRIRSNNKQGYVIITDLDYNIIVDEDSNILPNFGREKMDYFNKLSYYKFLKRELDENNNIIKDHPYLWKIGTREFINLDDLAHDLIKKCDLNFENIKKISVENSKVK